MLKYLQTVKDRLTGLKAGITNNAAAWTGQPNTPATVQADINLLDTADSEIEALKDQLSQKQTAAQVLAASKNDAAVIIEKRAIAIHATAPDKLVEYDIAVPSGQRAARTLPIKAVITSVTDDDDGIGFKIAMQSQVDIVDFWEIQRGQIVAAVDTTAATVLQPPYPFLKSTKKLLFVDDDVEAGVRYFYRVCGVNSTGAGAWSEPVSRVQ